MTRFSASLEAGVHQAAGGWSQSVVFLFKFRTFLLLLKDLFQSFPSLRKWSFSTI